MDPSYLQKSGSKSTAAIECALHSQGTLLNSIIYTLSQTASVLQSVSNKENAVSPSGKGATANLYSSRSDDNAFLENNTEAARLIKSNQQMLQQIQTEAGAIRTSVESLITAKKLEDRGNSVVPTTLLDKITFAEDTFLNNVSTCFKTLTQLTSLLQNFPVQSSSPSLIVSQTLAQLQTLHGNLSKVLDDFPDFSAEVNSLAKKPEPSLLSSPQQPQSSFRDRLFRDQGDLTRKLRLSISSLEKQQVDDAFSKLNAEIERNQELQAKLESRDHLLHRISLVVNEALDRIVTSLSQLVKLADSSEAQSYLNFIATEVAQLSAKSQELTAAPVKDSTKHLGEVKEEFETQKQIWTKKIAEIQSTLEEKHTMLMREIEAERQAHEDTTRRLRELQGKYKEQEDLEIKIKVLQNDLKARDMKLEQATMEMRRFEEITREVENLRIENQLLKNKNIERGEQVTHRDLHNRYLKEDIVLMKRDLDELNRIREEHKYLKEYKEKADAVIEKNSELTATMKQEFIREVEQLTAKIEQTQRKLM